MIKFLRTKLRSLSLLKNFVWSVYLVKGKELIPFNFEGFDYLQLSSSFATVTLGVDPNLLHDRLIIHESGGGGSVILAYALIEGELYIGLIKEVRNFQSNLPIWNVPRGMKAKHAENHDETARREFEEETGLANLELLRLKGKKTNANSTYFATWRDNEGICHYSVEFPAVLLEKTEKGRYHLINSKSARADILGEEILSTLTFFPVEEVSLLEDQFTLAILGRFLSQTFNFVPKNS